MSTTDTVRSRWAPLSLLALVAMLAALLTVTVGTEHSANAESHAGQATHDVSTAQALTASEAAFHDQMRKLWEDHVTWTRLAIVTFADGSAGFDATAARLLRNQQDIGDAIKPFYGDAAGDRLAALLRDHITIAVELLQAAKAGDDANVADASARWYANADDIADFLSAANPRFWPRDVMRSAMKTHLDQTLAEAQHELSGDYAASVQDYESIHAHILAMADLLSDGIVRSFPNRFH
jgi:hypothetical protein